MDAPAGLKESLRLMRQWMLLAENLHKLVPLAADAVLGEVAGEERTVVTAGEWVQKRGGEGMAEGMGAGRGG